ncbi:MAG: geranylgeranylglycerol-phosphate geranylgeranyltransferase [Bacteroidetes bacterium]|nr:geranylgeranylglycerol-phosphate geranylgeranyltransferase [Bacteroidota bacterium]MBI3481590.1 geranylgeranylglycerol-phosphate geranylgeranyltransferase [Bacteroidota bacterium]
MPSQQFSVKGFLKLTRFWNLLIIAFAQYFTATFLIDAEKIWDLKLLLLSGSTIIIAAAGYIINDYYDVKIDLINKPERVVIGKEVARRYAILFHSILSMIGTAIGFLLNWKIGVINFLSAFLLWWYSNDLKRQPFIGNFVVALLTGLSILLINILYHTNQPLVGIYSIFAFAMTLIREIVKDMEDLKGDNTFGCKTLPIIWGARKTKFFIYLLMAVLFGSVIYINELYKQLPLLYFFAFLFVPLVFLFARLVRADTKKDFYYLSQWCKVIMILGIVSMVFI